MAELKVEASPLAGDICTERRLRKLFIILGIFVLILILVFTIFMVRRYAPPIALSGGAIGSQGLKTNSTSVGLGENGKREKKEKLREEEAVEHAKEKNGGKNNPEKKELEPKKVEEKKEESEREKPAKNPVAEVPKEKVKVKDVENGGVKKGPPPKEQEKVPKKIPEKRKMGGSNISTKAFRTENTRGYKQRDIRGY